MALLGAGFLELEKRGGGGQWVLKERFFFSCEWVSERAALSLSGAGQMYFAYTLFYAYIAMSSSIFTSYLLLLSFFFFFRYLFLFPLLLPLESLSAYMTTVPTPP